MRVLTETGPSTAEKTASRKAASRAWVPQHPGSLALGRHVPEGQPKFRLISV